MIALQNLIKWVQGSFEVGNGGASAKKMTTWVFVLLSVYCHKFCTIENVIEFLIIDTSTIALLLTGSIIHNLKMNKQKEDAITEN